MVANINIKQIFEKAIREILREILRKCELKQKCGDIPGLNFSRRCRFVRLFADLSASFSVGFGRLIFCFVGLLGLLVFGLLGPLGLEGPLSLFFDDEDEDAVVYMDTMLYGLAYGLLLLKCFYIKMVKLPGCPSKGTSLCG